MFKAQWRLNMLSDTQLGDHRPIFSFLNESLVTGLTREVKRLTTVSVETSPAGFPRKDSPAGIPRKDRHCIMDPKERQTLKQGSQGKTDTPAGIPRKDRHSSRDPKERQTLPWRPNMPMFPSADLTQLLYFNSPATQVLVLGTAFLVRSLSMKSRKQWASDVPCMPATFRTSQTQAATTEGCISATFQNQLLTSWITCVLTNSCESSKGVH